MSKKELNFYFGIRALLFFILHKMISISHVEELFLSRSQGHSAIQEIPHFLQNPDVYYCFHSIPSLDIILRQITHSTPSRPLLLLNIAQQSKTEGDLSLLMQKNSHTTKFSYSAGHILYH
jgi:hypothetical protein